MREQLLDMDSQFYSCNNELLWSEFTQAISISKELSVVYLCSANAHKPDSGELLNAFRISTNKTHAALQKFLNSFIELDYNDDHDMSSPIEIRHDQTQISSGIPQHQSISHSGEHLASSEIELRSDTTNKYPSKTELLTQSRNLSRSPSNSHIPTYSRNVSWCSPNSNIQTQSEVIYRPRSKSQEKYEHDTRSIYSSVTRHRPQSRNSNRSPSSYRNRTRRERRNRSRSRSRYEQQFDSRSTDSYKKRELLWSRSRRKSQSKSPTPRKRVTELTSSFKSKNDFPTSPLKSDKSKSKKKKNNKYAPQKEIQHSSQKWKKLRFSQPEESTSLSNNSQLEEEEPISQNTYQAPNTFYPHNVTPMYYPQPIRHMPRLIRHPYYMPPRPHLPFPSTYPRVFFRPPWQPAV